MKTTEQLLADRFKVIAPYPGMKSHDWKVGDILDRNWCKYQNDDEDAGAIEWQLSDFPHLFQPLPWWSDRKPEDMPEYVKEADSLYKVGEVIKVLDWDWDRVNEVWAFQDQKDNYYTFVRGFEPATEDEYVEYINRKNAV